MKRLAYLPFSLAAGAIGSTLGRRAFRAAWTRISGQAAPPSPSAPELPLGRVALTAALEAATLAASAAVARQLAARVFHRLFGAWPVGSRA
jgi:predicted component of type VI protein secretion system